MILIADSGSTKTDWVLLDDQRTFRYKTIGYNPYFISSDFIQQSLAEKLVPQFDASEVKRVFFYGAGCSEQEKTEIVGNALSKCFSNATVLVGHDMLAAARALLGNEPGFAAILGTGSNTCLYDGNRVYKNIDSLGYLLGDEGSGSYIGRKILRDYLRGFLPSDLQSRFSATFDLSHSAIFEKLYHEPLPNRFLAGFCQFAHTHCQHNYVREVVRNAFRDFFTNLVVHYEGYQSYRFNCIGSVAFIFRDILTDVASEFHMQTGKIIHTPIENLVEYHLNNATQHG